MSQAEELLNSLPDVVNVVNADVNDMDCFVINHINRTITKPSNFACFGVEADRDADLIYFKSLNQVTEITKLSDLNLYINFKNAGGFADKYYVEDVSVVGDYIYFSWKLSEKVLAYKGNISFIVCGVKTLNDGSIDVEWNTTLCTGPVLEGLEVENPEDIQYESDMVDQLLNIINLSMRRVQSDMHETLDEIEKYKNDSIAAVDAAKQEALDYIGDGIDDTLTKEGVAAESKTVGDEILKSRIVDSASGEVVKLTDSADAPLHSLTLYGKTTQAVAPIPDNPQELVSVGETIDISVYGKNLFNNDTSLLKDVTFTGNSGGQHTKKGYVFDVLVTGTYTFSLTDLNTSLSKYIYGCINDKDGNYVRVCTLMQSANNLTPLTINVSKGDKIYIYNGLGNQSVTAQHFEAVKIQLESGSVATPFEEYKGLDTHTFTAPNGLKGIPGSGENHNYVDSNGKRWICDEIDLEKGVYIQKIGSTTFTGTESWNWGVSSCDTTKGCSADEKIFRRYISGMKPGGSLSNSIICTHYPANGYDVHYGLSNAVYISGEDVHFHHFGITTSDDFKEWLKSNPVTIYYELATPIETPLTDEQIEFYKSMYTHYPNTTVLNSENAGMKVEYVADTKLYIDRKIQEALNNG